MKKMLLAALVVMMLSGVAWAASMNVQVRNVEVKSQPSYLSSGVGRLGYGRIYRLLY